MDSSRGAKDVESDAPVVDREIPREVPAGLEPVTTVAGRALTPWSGSLELGTGLDMTVLLL